MPVLFAVLALGFVVAGLTLFARKGAAAEMPTVQERFDSLDDIFARVGAQYGVDPLLLKAHAIVESALRVDAVRWKPPHDVSVGLMQILCTPPEGTNEGENYVCQNAFNIQPWPVSFEDLKDPETNIALGAQVLAYNLRTYGFKRGIAAYNQWSARRAGPDGPFPNQAYVDKVLSHFNRLKG